MRTIRNAGRILQTVLLLCGGLAAAPSLQGQQPSLPRSAEPDVTLETLRPIQQPEPPARVQIREQTRTKAPPGSERVKFVLSALELTGVSAYPPERLDAIYADSIGKEVSLADVYAIADDIQRVYREDGYFLTRAILPPQETTAGKLRIQVLEGFVSEVRLEGEIGPAQDLVRSYLENVLGERPLKLKTLERYLLLSNDLPGLTVTGLLQPSPDELGAAQLVASVQRKKAEALVVLDNLGSSFTGEWELGGSASANSFTRFGERISITGLITDPPTGSSTNQEVVQLSGAFHPGSDGLYVNLFASYGTSNPGDALRPLAIENKKLLTGVAVGYPFIRTRDLNFAAELGFDYANSHTDVLNDIKLTRDRLRVVHATAIADFRDAWRGTTLASASLRQGVPLFNASKRGDALLSRVDGSNTFTSVRASALRVQPIVGDFAMFAEIAGQYAFNDLLSDEEFDVGGTRFGRGYDNKELSADHGLGITTELQHTSRPDIPYLDRLQFFGFYDIGKVWDRGSSFNASLSSAGGGVRVWLWDNEVSLALQLAKPLTRRSLRANNTRDMELLFRALAQF